MRSMTAAEQNSEICLPPRLWTRLRCSRCRYVQEHPGPVSEGDLDRACGLCGSMLGAVTTYKIGARPPAEP